nr:hypothetical protein Iba_chr02bCG25140 [Ipomoea batatas]
MQGFPSIASHGAAWFLVMIGRYLRTSVNGVAAASMSSSSAITPYHTTLRQSSPFPRNSNIFPLILHSVSEIQKSKKLSTFIQGHRLNSGMAFV